MTMILLVPVWLMTGLAAWTTFILLGLRFEPAAESSVLTEVYVRASMTSLAVLTSGRALRN